MAECRWTLTTIYHKTTYDFRSLASLLGSLDFCNIQYYDWRETEHAEFDDHSQAYIPHMDKQSGVLVSLNVECLKMSFETINEFEKQIANFFGSPYGVAVDCCTHALELCLRDQKIQKILDAKKNLHICSIFS